MVTKIDTQPISMSPVASQAVLDILAEKKLDGYALRIYAAGGGCCGIQFGMALDNNIKSVDTTFDINGIKLVVDETSIEYLRGASIDFVDDPQHGAGFVVNGPNTHRHEGEACACGGSCSCGH